MAFLQSIFIPQSLIIQGIQHTHIHQTSDKRQMIAVFCAYCTNNIDQRNNMRNNSTKKQQSATAPPEQIQQQSTTGARAPGQQSTRKAPGASDLTTNTNSLDGCTGPASPHGTSSQHTAIIKVQAPKQASTQHRNTNPAACRTTDIVVPVSALLALALLDFSTLYSYTIIRGSAI